MKKKTAMEDSGQEEWWNELAASMEAIVQVVQKEEVLETQKVIASSGHAEKGYLGSQLLTFHKTDGLSSRAKNVGKGFQPPKD